MSRYICGIVAISALAACKSTPVEQYQDLALVEAELLSEKWQNLERFPPLYPIEDARAGNEGCASVEYVIEPGYQIKDIKELASSSKHFAKQAKQNVQKWKWSDLPDGILNAPVKTKTNFHFCIETGDGHCSDSSFFENSQCAGADAIYSIGYRVEHRG